MSRWALIRNAMLATTALAPFAIVGAAANPLGPNVVGGSATRSDGVCTDQLLLHEVAVTLDKPVGTRPVIDATTARVLTLPAVPGG